MPTGSKATLAMALALVLGACAPDTAEETAEAPAQDTGTEAMPGMQGMGGMSAMQMGSDMTSHMERMQAMGGDSLMQMMPQHRQMLDNMMGQMNREMEGMNMAGDARWGALADSVRDDMARMREMAAAELQAFLPEHHGRVTRLMEMHGGMMNGR